MPTPVALLYGALACWLLAAGAIRIGWGATFKPRGIREARICVLLSTILMVMAVVLAACGIAGLLWGA